MVANYPGVANSSVPVQIIWIHELTMNCAADLMKMTLSCSVSTSVGISALGSYLQDMSDA